MFKTCPRRLSISGRLDYGIGRVIDRAGTATQRRRHFPCIMVIVEAKAQLLSYLACFHQSRLDRDRTDTSVGGVFCNGYPFVFVITHEGTVKISKIFDILQGNLLKVLGLTSMLERIVVMSPNVTPDRNGGDKNERS